MNYSFYEHRSTSYIYRLVLNANLGAIGAGVFFVALNACIWEVLKLIQSQDFFINLDKAILSAAIPFGAIFGGLVSSFLSNKFGRRKAMILADFFTIIGCLLSIHANLIVMLSGRVICGFVVGINYMVIPLYVREISPPDMSGRTGSYFRILFTLGILLAFVMSLGLQTTPDPNGLLWRAIFVLPCLFAVMRMLGFIIWVRMETPRYYMERNEEDNAIEALQKIFRGDQVQEVYYQEKKFDVTGFFDLFGQKYRRQTAIVILIIFATEFMGANALNFYTSIIFFNKVQETNNQYEQVRFLNIIFGAIRFLAAIFGMYMIDKTGRRPLLLYGSLLSIFLAISVFFSERIEFLVAQRTLVLLYAAVQGLTFTLVLPVYAAEVLPSFGIALQVVIQMICILLVTLFIPFASVEYSFLVFAVVGILTFLPIFYMAKETKGKTLNEIYRMFHAEKGSGLLDMEVEEYDAHEDYGL